MGGFSLAGFQKFNSMSSTLSDISILIFNSLE